MRNTPIGGAPSDSARQPTSARRMKANSMKGWVTASIMPAAARERLRPGRRSRHARRTLRPAGATSARLAGVSTLRVSPQATTSRAISSVMGKCARTCSMSCRAASTVRPSPCQRRIRRDEIGDGLGVDGAERLIEQDERGVLQQQAREQHALELAARQRADRTMPEVLQADSGERAADALLRARASSPRQAPILRHSPIATQSNTEMGKLRSMSICCGR